MNEQVDMISEHRPPRCFLHDLRNLTCVISYQSEMGYRGLNLGTDDLRKLLGRIHEAARMTIELIESEASGYIEPECLDLREIIARVAEVARGRSRYDTKVQCILPHDPVWIDDHPEAALRLCLNLALNAVDATPGGEVTLSVSGHTDATAEVDLIAGKLPQPPFVMLDVADDGPGIPDE